MSDRFYGESKTGVDTEVGEHVDDVVPGDLPVAVSIEDLEAFPHLFDLGWRQPCERVAVGTSYRQHGAAGR